MTHVLEEMKAKTHLALRSEGFSEVFFGLYLAFPSEPLSPSAIPTDGPERPPGKPLLSVPLPSLDSGVGNQWPQISPLSLQTW